MMKLRTFNLIERLSTIHKSRKLLGVHIDYKLKFDTHIETLYKKVEKTFMPLPEL